jgi:hypothetical protein
LRAWPGTTRYHAATIQGRFQTWLNE